jgi:hypothetical protein
LGGLRVPVPGPVPCEIQSIHATTLAGPATKVLSYASVGISGELTVIEPPAAVQQSSQQSGTGTSTGTSTGTDTGTGTGTPSADEPEPPADESTVSLGLDYDPGHHTVPEVVEYALGLGDIHLIAQLRQKEAEGKHRSSLLAELDSLLH